jgi:hypothetical protein
MMGIPSCREVTREIASDSLIEAPAHRRLAVWVHLLLCRHCRRYARQMRAIGQAARDVFARPTGEEESVERLHRRILGGREPPEAD